MTEHPSLSPSQLGLGDMDPAEFRAAAHRVADIVADYLETVSSRRVLPDFRPGDGTQRLPEAPPSSPEPLDAILGDYLSVVEPNITHWQHPGFMAYFASVASGPGILGEWLAAGLNSNVMFWRVAPVSTELEQVVVGWLRRMLGLPGSFDGMFTDTASTSTLTSILAARHAWPGLDARQEGLAGREGLGRLRIYCSAEAHSSIDRAAIVAGVGLSGVRRIEADAEFRMSPEALERAIEEDRAAGWWPFCAVATLGTTSSTSVDPVDAIATICEREGMWLHVDAAYGGSAALAPEYRALFRGWERADSIVVNPHKWMFTPFDASLLLFRRPDVYRDAFRLVPEYLKTPEGEIARNFNEYGIPLGRRFRALKLWIMIRWFGADGMAARIREHCRQAAELASWVDADPDWERLAPVPFSTVCFRHRPARLQGRETEPAVAVELDRKNEAILEHVNRSGDVFLSHTKLAGRYTLRVSLGNPRATPVHVRLCWNHIKESAASLERA